VFQEPDGTERTLEDVESGDILRDVMLGADPAVDLYTTWGKVVTCGGGGQCGTCIVEVLEGEELLDERNDTEQKKLKKKPASYRLACQTNVGNGENAGTLRFRTKPK
jgi:ferredoxin